MKRLAFVLLLILPSGCSSTTTAAPDISGVWLIKQDRSFDGKPHVPGECTFNQRGGELSVKCGGDMNGTVRGRTVTWGFEKSRIPPMLEDRLVLIYAAELDASETSLKGTWRLYSGVLDERGTFEAQKRKVSAD